MVWVEPHLLQLLGDPHAGVDLLSPLSELSLVVLQEVTSGELSGQEVGKGRV